MKFFFIFLLSGLIGFLISLFVSQHHFARFYSLYFPDSPLPSEDKLLPPPQATLSGTSTPPQIYGINVDMSQVLPASQKYIVNDQGDDLIDIAKKLGINFFRLTNNTRSFENGENSLYTHEQWATILNKLQKNNIQALILIETASSNPNFYTRSISAEYLHLVDDYITSDMFSHPAVYGVDLKNEPMLNDQNIRMLRTAAERIKAAYPSTRLTVGWWSTDTFKKDDTGKEIVDWNTFASGKKLADFIDFYSIHMYDFDKSTFGRYPDPYTFSRHFIAEVVGDLNTKKPVLIEEFGAANGEAISDQDTIGSPQVQANTYAGVYQQLRDQNDPQILGTVAYQFHSQTRKPDAWAIVTHSGNEILPAGYVIQKFATGRMEQPLTLPIEPIPASYLFENAQNTQTVTIHPNDLIGISLSLDPSYRYIAEQSGGTTLATNEELIYNNDHQKYQAVYVGKQPGPVQLLIRQSDSDRIVFSLRIRVQ